jgi:Rrf2 family transcriptional regulator, cysteine metabolism repressor
VKLSIRSDYGARAVVDLARRYGEGPVQSAEIAAREAIPEAYLEQLLTSLRRAGLIRSSRGPRGGHELARDPATITFADVIGALEGPFLSLDCLGGAEPAAEGATTAAITREVWQDVADAAHRILRATTIEALVERQRAREQRAMYHI